MKKILFTILSLISCATFAQSNNDIRNYNSKYDKFKQSNQQIISDKEVIIPLNDKQVDSASRNYNEKFDLVYQKSKSEEEKRKIDLINAAKEEKQNKIKLEKEKKLQESLALDAQKNNINTNSPTNVQPNIQQPQNTYQQQKQPIPGVTVYPSNQQNYQQPNIYR